MSKRLEHARKQVPTVILTVLSMIQALALEFFWTRAAGLDVLWQGGWDAAIVWLQLFITLAGILLIWVAYVNFVMRFSWLPTMPEMILPFFIGILEFAAIELIHPGPLGPWLLLLAAVFAAMVYSAYLTTTASRREPSNAYFFEGLEAPTWRTYRESIGAIALISLCGVLSWMLESKWIAVLALLVALAALIYQFTIIRGYWLHGLDDERPAD